MDTEPTKQTKKLYLVEGSYKVVTHFTAYILADSEDEASDIASEIDSEDTAHGIPGVVGFADQDSECFPEPVEYVEDFDGDVPKFARTYSYKEYPQLPK